MFGVTKSIEDRGERSDGGYGSEQDGSGAERLAAGDIEARSGESGDDAGGEGLLHGWWSLGVPGASRGGQGSTGLAAIGIVNGLPKGRVSSWWDRQQKGTGVALPVVTI
jgi:hypothetical protein